MTRQQRWAAGALARVMRHGPGADGRRKPGEGKYRTLCMKMPILIKQSGLAQAMAFMLSRAEKEGKEFCDDLAGVYGVEAAPAAGNQAALSPGEVLRRQVYAAGALGAYLSLSRDLIDVSVWFRRFAQSELEPGEGG